MVRLLTEFVFFCLIIVAMEISIFLKCILNQATIQYLGQISHRSESGKTAKRPIENIRYGPEKSVLRHLVLEIVPLNLHSGQV